MPRSAAIFDQVARGIISRFVYVADQKQYGKLERWNDLQEVAHNKLAGDCVAEGEKILAIRDERLCAVEIENIRTGDTVLSYDLDAKRYTHEKVLNARCVGELQTVDLLAKNRTSVRVSGNHPMWIRQNQQTKGYVSNYQRVAVSDIDLDRWWKRRIPVVSKLHYPIADMDYSADFCFMLGHFLAEGWVEGAHVCTSGHDIDEHIAPILKAENIPYSRYVNNSGVPCVRFLSSPTKELFSEILNNSFDMCIPQAFMSLPQEKLRRILDGYFLGDGHHHQGRKYYSTSCEAMANQLREISLKLGEPAYVYKQAEHGGVGVRPIYRVIQHPNGFCARGYGYEGLSETSIVDLVPSGIAKCYDITVDRTATFIFANGLLSHNCEDFAISIVNQSVVQGAELSDFTLYMVAVGDGPDHVVLGCYDDIQNCIWIADCNAKRLRKKSENFYFKWVSERNLGQSKWVNSSD